MTGAFSSLKSKMSLNENNLYFSDEKLKLKFKENKYFAKKKNS